MKIPFIVILFNFYCLLVVAQKNGKSILIQNLGKDTQLNSLLIDSTGLYIGNSNGNLMQYKIKNDIFKLFHVFNIKGTVVGKPVITDNNLLVSGDNVLFCLKKNGVLKWQHTFPRLIKSNILFYSNKVFIDCRDSGIFCVNSDNGNVIWQYKSNEGTIGGMLIIKRRLFVSGLGHELLCLNSSNGLIIWKKIFNDYLLSDLSSDENFIAINFCNFDSKNQNPSFLGLIDIYTGTMLVNPRYLVNCRYKPTFNLNSILLGTEDCKIVDFNLKNRKELWTIKLPDSDVISTNFLRMQSGNNEIVYFGSINRMFYKLDLSNHQIKYKEGFDYGLSELFYEKNNIFFMTGDGNLYKRRCID